VGALDHAGLVAWLREADPRRLARLWALADAVRHAQVGEAVELRGLIEISSHCVRRCTYCGLRAPNRAAHRYRLADDEIVATAHLAVDLGYGTVVLQSGEDPAFTLDRLVGLVRRLRAETGLAITLSLGERTVSELAALREAGADRYLLRFETASPTLYARIHPARGPGLPDRLALLAALGRLGYEVGSGVMVGIPGQTWADLARDLETFRELGLDMIGVGPFLPHPDTPLGHAPGAGPDQVPATEATTYRVLALTRLVRPDANLPVTTALAVTSPDQGRRLGLMRGGNVLMPNLTPAAARVHYTIYPGKAAEPLPVGEAHRQLLALLASLGRYPGTGPGGSPSYRTRRPQEVNS
jgi:biotin synthase